MADTNNNTTMASIISVHKRFIKVALPYAEEECQPLWKHIRETNMTIQQLGALFDPVNESRISGIGLLSPESTSNAIISIQVVTSVVNTLSEMKEDPTRKLVDSLIAKCSIELAIEPGLAAIIANYIPNLLLPETPEPPPEKLPTHTGTVYTIHYMTKKQSVHDPALIERTIEQLVGHATPQIIIDERDFKVRASGKQVKYSRKDSILFQFLRALILHIGETITYKELDSTLYNRKKAPPKTASGNMSKQYGVTRAKFVDAGIPEKAFKEWFYKEQFSSKITVSKYLQCLYIEVDR